MHQVLNYSMNEMMQIKTDIKKKTMTSFNKVLVCVSLHEYNKNAGNTFNAFDHGFC